MGSRLAGIALPLLPLALAACRVSAPDAEEYDQDDTESTTHGDDPLPPASSTSAGADEASGGHSESGTSGGSIPPETDGTSDGDPDGTSDGESTSDGGPVCGDGVVEGDEICDDAGRSATCDEDCTAIDCGDGTINDLAGEECDDVGESATCDADCTLAQCGDSTLNATAMEECDGADLGGSTCVAMGFAGGRLGCDDTCHLDTTACFACGDGTTNPGESCDGGDLGGQTCIGLGFDGGELACSDVCGYDTSGCYECGDGAVNPGEQCDGAALGGSTCAALGFLGGTLACSPACTYDTAGCYTCSDGLHNGDETDVDCGGACGAVCDPGDGCLAGTDCVTHGCDATTSTCNDFLSVEVAPECASYSGAPAVLTATATGGSGSYTYAWTPNDGTLTAPDQAVTGATPGGQQTYTVTVDDGFATAQDSVTVVSTTPLDLDLGCNVYGANTYGYQLGGTRTCATSNTNPGLHLCEGTPLSNVRLRATLQVTGSGDDDSMGLVWGAQDESHFYSLSWRAGGICGAAGIVVKRVEGPSFAVVGTNDVHCPNDTPNSTFLLGPGDTTSQPWVHGAVYDVTIDYTDTGSAVTVVDQGSGAVIADFFVADTTFTSGYFGATTYSQQGACIGPLSAECL